MKIVFGIILLVAVGFLVWRAPFLYSRFFQNTFYYLTPTANQNIDIEIRINDKKIVDEVIYKMVSNPYNVLPWNITDSENKIFVKLKRNSKDVEDAKITIKLERYRKGDVYVGNGEDPSRFINLLLDERSKGFVFEKNQLIYKKLD